MSPYPHNIYYSNECAFRSPPYKVLFSRWSVWCSSYEKVLSLFETYDEISYPWNGSTFFNFSHFYRCFKHSTEFSDLFFGSKLFLTEENIKQRICISFTFDCELISYEWPLANTGPPFQAIDVNYYQCWRIPSIIDAPVRRPPRHHMNTLNKWNRLFVLSAQHYFEWV